MTGNQDSGANGNNKSEDNSEVQVDDQKAADYIKVLLTEKLEIDKNKYPNAYKFLEEEIANVQSIGRVPQREKKYVDVYREKPTKVSVKVKVPFKENPKFNFMGKILGPKGSTMKRLQEDTMCKIAILGRNSMRDKNKEEELRNSLDPKYSHLTDDLHIEISALGPPAEAHARMAYALAEVKQYLIPDFNEMQSEPLMGGGGPPNQRRPGPGPSRPPQQFSRPGPPRGPPAGRPGPGGPGPRGMGGPKGNVMSILDRARGAMQQPPQDSYDYEEEEEEYEAPSAGYGGGYNQNSSYSSGGYGGGGGNAGGNDYEEPYYKKPAASGYGNDSYQSRGWKQQSSFSKPAGPSGNFRQGDNPRYKASPYFRPMK